MATGSRVVFEPFDGSTWRDPFPVYRTLRDEDPVHFVPDHDFWILTRFEDVFTAARDPETFSSAQGVTIVNELEELGLVPTILQSDAPTHTRYRRVVGRMFTPRRVQGLTEAFRGVARRQVETMREEVTGDFVADFAKVLPGFAMRHYLGVPESDRAAFDAWVELFVQGDAAGHDQAAPQAVAELGAYLAGMVEKRRASPGDDLVSAFLAPDAGDAEQFTLEEILGFIFVFISGGNDTVAGALGGTAELLTRHPDQAARLARDTSLVPGAVEELLRLVSPAQGLARITTRAVSVSGTDIPEGSRVLLCFGAANRDDREFGDSAEQLDIERPITRTLAFGSGAHFCLGAAVARLQLKVALEELLELPHLVVDHEAGVFADGMFLRRYETLPYTTDG